jgi:hypothetical protein
LWRPGIWTNFHRSVVLIRYEVVDREWNRPTFKKALPPVACHISWTLLVRKSAHTKQEFKAVKSIGTHNQVTSLVQDGCGKFLHSNHQRDQTRSTNIVVSAKVCRSNQLHVQLTHFSLYSYVCCCFFNIKVCMPASLCITSPHTCFCQRFVPPS